MKYINNLDMHAEKDDERWRLVCSTARSTTATARLTAAVKIAGDGESVLENAYFRESRTRFFFYFLFQSHSIYCPNVSGNNEITKMPPSQISRLPKCPQKGKMVKNTDIYFLI
jgi:hypothetical protein